jgi:superfamily II DNA/RNA helicase
VVSGLFSANPEVDTSAVQAQHNTSARRGQRKSVPTTVFAQRTFRDLGLSDRLVQHLNQAMGMHELTVPQKLACPLLLKNQDVMLRSPTGTGKTLAYALPIVHDLQQLQHKVPVAPGQSHGILRAKPS